MNTQDGKLWFGSGIDTTGLQRDADKVRQTIRGISDNASAESARLESMFKNLGGALAGAFTIRAAIGFVQKMAEVRGEFQQLEVAFTTFLKSKEKADKLMAQAVDLAAKTPFTLTEVATGAKQLLAYGFGVEGITKDLTMLGNVAAGVSAPLGDIVYLYGTLRTQGRAYTRDIMQFTSRGIPILEELAKVMGTNTQKVQEMVTAGKVGFAEVEKAFKGMTGEGGKFYNLMEEQSKTITGKISNLGDAISRMFNDMGKAQEGAIAGTLDTLIELTANYKEVGRAILELVAIYGAYKTAVLATAIIEKAVAASKTAQLYLELNRALGVITMAHKANAAAMAIEEGAASALNKTLIKNPYALIIAGLVAFGIAMYKGATAMTEAEKAKRKLDQATAEFTSSLIVEQTQIDTLFAKLNAAKKGTKEYDDIKREIYSKYGTYLKSLGDEATALNDVAKAYKTITEEAEKAAKARAMNKFTEQAASDLGEKMNGVLSDLKTTLEDKYIKEFGERYGKKKALQVYYQLVPVLSGQKAVDKATQAIIDSFTTETRSTASSFGTGTTTPTFHNNLKVLIDQAQVANQVFKETSQQAADIFGQALAPESIKPTTDGFKSFDQQLKEAKDSVTKLKKELSNLKEGKVPSENYATDIENKQKELDAAQKALDTLTGKVSDKTIKAAEKAASEKAKQQAEALKADRDFQREQQDQQVEANQAYINLWDEGLQKELEQLRHDHDVKLVALKRYAEDEQQKIDELELQLSEAKTGKKNYVDPDIKARMDGVRVQIQQNLQTATDYENAYFNKVYSDSIDNQLKNYQSFNDRRAALDKEYADKAADIIATSALAGIDPSAKLRENERKYKEALTDLNAEILKSYGLLQLYEGSGGDLIENKIKQSLPLFTDISHATYNELGKIKEIIKDVEIPPETMEALKQAGIDVEKLKAALQQVKQSATEATDERMWDILLTAVSRLSGSLKKLGSALEQTDGILGDMGKVVSGLADNMDNLSTAFSKTATNADKISAGIDAIANLYSMVAGQIAENKQAQEEWNDKIAEGAQKARMLQIEAAGYKEANIFGVENPYSEAIAGAQQYALATEQLLKLQKDLGEGQIQTGTKNVVDWGNVASGVSSGAAAGAAVGSIVPVIGTVLGAGIGALIGGLIGVASTKVEPVFAKLKDKYGYIANEAFELNPEILADYDKLDEDTQKLIDNWEEVKQAQEEARQEMEQNFKDLAGDIGQNLSDALVEAFRNGNVYGAMDDFHAYMTKIIENLIQQMIFAQFIEPLLNNLQTQFFASFGRDENGKRMTDANGNPVYGDQSIVDELQMFYDNIGPAIEQYNQAMSAIEQSSMGTEFPLFQPTSSSSTGSTGAFQSMSQDTGNALEGRFTAIQMLMTEMNSSMSLMLSDTGQLRINSDTTVGKLGELREISLSGIDYLIKIEKNTHELYEMNTTLKKIKENTDNL